MQLTSDGILQSPRGERDANYFRTIRHGRALELLGTEATHEGIEPFIDGSFVILVFERLACHVFDLLASKTKAEKVIQEEVMQVVRSHFVFGLLGYLTVLVGRQKFR